MLPRRTIRITAATLAILLAVAIILGYDFHLDINITETFFSHYIE